jgi:hypothetical protein
MMSEPASNQPAFPEIEELLGAMVDGELRVDQRERLSTLLRGNVEAQSFYRDYLATHVALEFRYGWSATPPLGVSDPLGEPKAPNREQSQSSRYPFSNAMILPSLQEIEAELGAVSEPPISLPAPDVSHFYARKETSLPRRPRVFRRVWTAAAMIVVVASVSIALLEQDWKPGPQPVVASITAQVDSKWGTDSLPTGPLRSGQHLVLTEGYAEIAFVTGANVVVQAPADFTLESRSSMTLSTGKLAATVIGGGFVVKTPSAAVTDLGTQFGVAIAADRSTRVEVFKGAVEAALTNPAAAERQTLVSGQAADVTGTRMQIDPAGAQPQRFVRTLAGLVVRGELVADLRPDLSSATESWTNHAEGAKSVGAFAPGPQGRWAVDAVEGPVGKTIAALHLSREGTISLFSAKSVPADLTQSGSVSVEAWLKADAPLGAFNAVATWGEGKFGAQRDFLYGTITPFVGDYADLEDWGNYQPAVGKWHYVVWVYRQESKNMTVYVDGEQVKTGKVVLNTSASPLVLGAGPDAVPANNFASEPLNGYLGAFRVETGVLSTSDVQHNFERGMPADDGPIPVN